MALSLVTSTWTPPMIPRRRSACSSTAKHEVEIASRAWPYLSPDKRPMLMTSYGERSRMSRVAPLENTRFLPPVRRTRWLALEKKYLRPALSPKHGTYVISKYIPRLMAAAICATHSTQAQRIHGSNKCEHARRLQKIMRKQQRWKELLEPVDA